MPIKFSPLVLSLSLAQPLLMDKLHANTLAEPLHTHELPKIPGQTISVSAPPISGANVTAQSCSVDAFIADADLVLPFGGLLTAADRRGAHAANLCTVYTGTGTAYVLGVQLGRPLKKEKPRQ
jgi:hypothetical protein